MQGLYRLSKTIHRHRVFFWIQYFVWLFMLVSQYLGNWSKVLLYIIVPVFILLNVCLVVYIIPLISRPKRGGKY